MKEGEWHKFFPDVNYMSIGKAMDFICNHYRVPEKTAKFMLLGNTTNDSVKNKKVTLFG